MALRTNRWLLNERWTFQNFEILSERMNDHWPSAIFTIIIINIVVASTYLMRIRTDCWDESKCTEEWSTSACNKVISFHHNWAKTLLSNYLRPTRFSFRWDCVNFICKHSWIWNAKTGYFPEAVCAFLATHKNVSETIPINSTHISMPARRQTTSQLQFQSRLGQATASIMFNKNIFQSNSVFVN